MAVSVDHSTVVPVSGALLRSTAGERLTWLASCVVVRSLPARFHLLACDKLNMCRALLQAHEVEGCSFPANISDRANLTVAGQALTALDGSNLFGSHGTVFLPNDAAFTALVTALSEFHVLRRQSHVPHPVSAYWRAALLQIGIDPVCWKPARRSLAAAARLAAPSANSAFC